MIKSPVAVSTAADGLSSSSAAEGLELCGLGCFGGDDSAGGGEVGCWARRLAYSAADLALLRREEGGGGGSPKGFDFCCCFCCVFDTLMLAYSDMSVDECSAGGALK